MIRTEEIKKQYGDKQVLNGISTHIEQGEVLDQLESSGKLKESIIRNTNLMSE